jgi:quercetin dioxygenase-like cupin family protein
MHFIKYIETTPAQMRPGVDRRLGYTPNLMMTVIDFNNGPATQPDPLHSHPHEQITYVAEGEIVFVLGEDSARLGPGDMVVVPSGVPHAIQLLTPHARLIDSFTPIRQDFLED